jgi:hypothetical protein
MDSRIRLIVASLVAASVAYLFAVIRVTEKPDHPELAGRLVEACEHLVRPNVWDYRVND